MSGTRKTTGRAADLVAMDPLPPAAAADFVGFRPTPYQQRVRAQYWDAVRDDPMTDPRSLPAPEIARLVGEPRVESWSRDPAFLSWFRKEEAWRSHADWLHDLWLEKAFDVLMHPLIEPAQFIALGRELAKMTGRAAPTGSGSQAGPASLTPEQALALVEKQARALGFVRPSAPTSQPAAHSEDSP